MPLEPFEIPLWVELAAVALGALQGALFAGSFADRGLDVLGGILIGVGVALGGSLLRDILLGVPPAAIYGEWYILAAAATALFGLVLQHSFERLDRLILALDAVTIGLFGAIGTSKALSLGVPSIPAIFIGAAAAVGGSVVRDVTLALPVALLHVGSLYAVAAAAGGALLVLLVSVGVAVFHAAIAAVALTTVLRLLAVSLGWKFPERSAIAVHRRSRA